MVLGKERDYEFNHNIIIKVQELPYSIKVTRKPMVCESPSKRLVVQTEDASP